MAQHIVPRDYQVPYIEYLANEEGPITKLIPLQTGKGKGIVSLCAVCKINKKVLIVVLPKYIEKWKKEILEVTTATEEEVVTVRGGDQLRYVVDEGINGCPNGKFYIISNRTLLNFIKNYEQANGDPDLMEYDITPDQLTEVLGTGVLLFDEVHQDFHGNFKVSLYMQVKMIIGLSATLESEDRFVSRMHQLMFPEHDRPDKKAYDKYIRVYPVRYRFDSRVRIRFKSYGSNRYSHIEFEKSIMRNKKLLKDYVELIAAYVEYGYIRRRKNGDKVAVFASTIKMCTLLTEYFSKKYPDLDVRRYVKDDPFENIIEPDIRVTTIMSGGTAIDIPNLITVVQSIVVMSIVANIQTVGRLRKLDGKEVEFYYLYCSTIPKHVECHEGRIRNLKNKVLRIDTIDHPNPLGVFAY